MRLNGTLSASNEETSAFVALYKVDSDALFARNIAGPDDQSFDEQMQLSFGSYRLTGEARVNSLTGPGSAAFDVTLAPGSAGTIPLPAAFWPGCAVLLLTLRKHLPLPART